jgi:hypothetical protein
MKNMLRIEEIVESTIIPPFLNNSKIGVASFMNLLKVFVRRSAFKTFPSA